MVRKWLPVLFALMLIAAACGDSDDDDGGTTETTGGEGTTETTEGGATDTTEGGATDTTEGGATDTTGESAGPAEGEPIRLGAVGSQSGVNIFPEPMQAAQAVFDRYNEQGGLDGRPIELIVEDDTDTAEGAAAAARRLVEDEQVLGLTGGGSIVDCTTNAEYYAQQAMNVIPGANACAEAPTISPVNTGPFIPTQHMLDFFLHDLGLERICFSALNVPLNDIMQGIIVPMWEEANGVSIHSYILSEAGEDLTPAVTKAANDDCQAVLLAYTEPDYQAYFQIADAQGLTDEIVYGMLTSGYSLNLLDAAGSTMEGAYANSEFEPFTGVTEDSPEELLDFIQLMEDTDQPLTSFGESGYIAANIVIQALESIEGEITKESVNEAFANVVYETELLAVPFEFTGFAPGVQPNLASKITQVQGDDFVTVTDWRFFPLEGAGGGAPTTTAA